jgi:hypothetical protein
MSTDFANIHASGFDDVGSYAPDKLLDRDTHTLKVTIDAGNLARGTLLGQVTTGGKYIQSLSAASDGSEVPCAILLHPVDASSADQEAIVADAGYFAAEGVVFGTGHTLASTRSALAARGIFIDESIG